MKRISFCFIFLFFIVSSSLFAQSFKDFKNTKEGKYVYFTLTGVRDQEHADNINAVLQKDPNVTKSVIYLSKTVYLGKLLLKNDANAFYFKKIIQSMEADIAASSIIDYNNSFDTKISEHYPLFINTGNPEKDNANFDNAKKLWLKNYPKEVIMVTKRNYYDVVAEESFYKNEKPVLIDTGDPELDKQIFEKRSAEWHK